MADDPEQEPKTFIQKAVKIGLIVIPIMWYISWAHKKFVPCPKAYRQQGNRCGSKVRKKSKEKAQKMRPEQNCEKTKSHSNKREPSRHEFIGYFKQSAKQCSEKIKNPSKQISDSSQTEALHPQQGDPQKTNQTCCTQPKREPADDTGIQSNSESISPEAFDKLFEQHFQKCVDDFKQHKKQIEQEMKRLGEEREREESTSQKPPNDGKGKYLGCLADLNLDKDFECDPSFYSKDLDTPYVMKDYTCKTRRQTHRPSYLQSLADLNMDNNFEPAETKVRTEGRNDFCSKRTQEKWDEGKKCSNKKSKQESTSKTEKEDACKWETQEITEDVTVNGKRSPNYDGGVSNIYTRAESDDCGCNPHSNTKSYDREDPCADRSTINESDDDALKNFWHACGPPKGLRTGCRATGCQNSTKKQD